VTYLNFKVVHNSSSYIPLEYNKTLAIHLILFRSQKLYCAHWGGYHHHEPLFCSMCKQFDGLLLHMDDSKAENLRRELRTGCTGSRRSNWQRQHNATKPNCPGISSSACFPHAIHPKEPLHILLMILYYRQEFQNLLLWANYRSGSSIYILCFTQTCILQEKTSISSWTPRNALHVCALFSNASDQANFPTVEAASQACVH
jgi:hypothetical protein